MEAYRVSSTISNILVKCDSQSSAIQWISINSFSNEDQSLQFEQKKLEMTLRMIQARLGDAQTRAEGDNEELVKEWLKNLKHICYRLEDLLEEAEIASAEEHQNLDFESELETIKAPKRLCTSYPSSSSSSTINLKLPLNSWGTTEDLQTGKANEKLCTSNPSSASCNMKNQLALEAKGIMGELDHLTNLMESLHQFRELPLKQESVVHHTDDRETHSFVEKDDVIGRDEDKDKIVSMLLDSNHGDENVVVIPIVGIGGLGKTTLAQLIYNDQCVQNHFDKKYWACISDITSLKELAGKVLTAITGADCHKLTLVKIQSQLRQEVSQKKYLLVMDDMWDEDRNRWLELRRLLRGGKQGSRILVTSRSQVVAQNVSKVEPYMLEGLAEEKSWDLFRSLAFKEGLEEGNPNMVRIGKEILKKCANVPLAIRTIACLLYTMDTESEWEYFNDNELMKIEQGENKILSTLKLSYNHLPSPLKSCFAYCSVFPKDYVFDERDLVYLWMAQGFIESSNGHSSLKAIGHGYFMQLQRRCFFQKFFVYDEDIKKWKMHDLLHDLAQLVAGGETLSVDGPTWQCNDNILHVSVSSDAPLQPLATERMRSFIFLFGCGNRVFYLEVLKCIRALDFKGLVLKNVPDSIRELKHLRYLRLGSYIDERLPECITKLQMLQTLDLGERKFNEWPRSIMKLINLKHLHLDGEPDMPYELGKLTSLETLDRYVVGKRNRLDALASLTNLTGKLQIYFKRDWVVDHAKTGILKDTKLTKLILHWPFEEYRVVEEDEVALRCLHPPPTLQHLKVDGWGGVRFGLSSWRMDEFPSFLPNLVSIDISYCYKCKELPHLNELPHLKSIHLKDLSALEYIEMMSGEVNNMSTHATRRTYFPSLETLSLERLPKLKRDLSWLPPFPRLSQLYIDYCPEFKTMPSAPSLVSLEIGGYQELENITAKLPNLVSLQKLKIKNLDKQEILGSDKESTMEILISQSMRALTCVTTLQKLHIEYSQMRGLPESIRHLTQLRCLNIVMCDKLEALPESLGNLTLLQDLQIWNTPKLKSLPESFGKLAAHLQSLTFFECPELVRRCRQEYWPLIQHIPHLHLR